MAKNVYIVKKTEGGYKKKKKLTIGTPNEKNYFANTFQKFDVFFSFIVA